MAEWSTSNGEPAMSIAHYLRETADIWYSNIDRWIYATGTELASRVGVEGYYERIAPPETSDAASPVDGFVAIKNRPPDSTSHLAASVVSPDALALVREGIDSMFGDPI